MYKSKLQELCHSKSWNLPEYVITKNGPDHYPDFGASVSVNGILFQTQAPVKSSKTAKNDVAKLVFDYFSTLPFQQAAPQPTIPTTLRPPPQPLVPVQPQQQPFPLQQHHQDTYCLNYLFPQPSLPTQASHQLFNISLPGSVESICMNDKFSGVPMSSHILKDKSQLPVVNATSSVLNDYDSHIEPRRMYKNQLQHYAQKKNLKFPMYSCEREGPPHASRFKCNMTIDGKTYMSDGSFFTIKDAENDVARVALASLSQLGTRELIQDDPSFYKNLLQELAQKKKSILPIYKTEAFGEFHTSKFISTVEFEGETFTGQASRTKKQAEMSAAEVAYHAMRKSLTSERETAHNLQLNMTNEPQQFVKSAVSLNLNSPLETAKQAFTSRRETTDNLQLNMTNDPQQFVKADASINLNSCLETAEQGQDGGPAGEGDSNLNNGGIQNALPSPSNAPSRQLSPTGEGTPSKRICVYPRMPNMTYPEGSVVLPMSDDKWVALCLSGNQDYSANV